MSERKKSKYGPPYVIDDGPDVDLEAEDIRDSKGNRIDQAYVDRAVEDVHRTLGRPKL